MEAEKEDVVDSVSWIDRQTDHFLKFSAIAYPPLILGGAIFAYFFQPTLRFAASYHAYEGAFILTLALILAAASFKLRRDYLALVFGIGGTILGTYWLNDVVENAAKLAAVNATRCAQIEVEMLKPKPRRDDLPELFSAFGCYSQTNVGIQFVSDTASKK